MKNSGHIDRLFQEQFKDFEAVPPADTWQNIAGALAAGKKNKRTAAPLWYKLAGAAAAIALLLTLGNFFFNKEEGVPLVDTDRESDRQQTKIQPATEQDELLNIPKATQAGTHIVASDVQDGTEVRSIATTSSPVDKKTDGESVRGDIAHTGEASDKTRRDFQTAQPEKTVPPVDGADHKESIARVEKKEGIKGAENVIKEPQGEDGISLIEYAKEKEAQESLGDEDGAGKNLNRWEVAPNVAPVYYSSLSSGSSLDPSLADNSVSGEVNMSYGVQVSYAVNDKLSVRAGVNKVRLGYGVDDIEYATTDGVIALQHVDYGDYKPVIVAGRGMLPEPPPADPQGGNDEFEMGFPRPGALQQRLDYIEAPVELKYSLVNGRFGVHLIGGVSTLFLSDNEVFVQSDMERRPLGEADNLNPVSFTTNAGLGFGYRLTNKLLFNVDPIFKYQLNAHTSGSDGGFRPYFIGVYSGLNFRF